MNEADNQPMRFNIYRAIQVGVVCASALTSVLAIGQDAKNPFDGSWTVDMNRAGRHVLAWRKLGDSETRSQMQYLVRK